METRWSSKSSDCDPRHLYRDRAGHCVAGGGRLEMYPNKSLKDRLPQKPTEAFEKCSKLSAQARNKKKRNGRSTHRSNSESLAAQGFERAGSKVSTPAKPEQGSHPLLPFYILETIQNFVIYFLQPRLIFYSYLGTV